MKYLNILKIKLGYIAIKDFNEGFNIDSNALNNNNASSSKIKSYEETKKQIRRKDI